MDPATIIMAAIGGIRGGGDPVEILTGIASDLFVGGVIDQESLDNVTAAAAESDAAHASMAASARAIIRRRAEAAGDGA